MNWKNSASEHRGQGYVDIANLPLGRDLAATAVEYYFDSHELRNCFAPHEIIEYKEFKEEDCHGPVRWCRWACILGRKVG